MCPDLTINLASESEYFRYSSQPDYFETVVAEKKPRLVLVDEIQRLPSLLNSIQFLLDEKKELKAATKFLLSGSSARKLKRGHANLLPGRIFTFQMAGLAAHELDYKINYRRSLSYGFLPEPQCEKDPKAVEKLLSNYSATYLREEIQSEALTRNISGFGRFLNVIAANAGQVIDYSKLATEAKVSRAGSLRFFEILEDTLIAERIESFVECEAADVIKHPKFFFFDVGVLNGLLDNFTASSDRAGRLFEHLVYQQLRNSAFARDERIDFKYFRTRHGLEVDFIVKFKSELWAIEAKCGPVNSSDLESLQAFKKYCPQVSNRVAVSLSEPIKRKKNGILICDLNELLKEMEL